MIIAFIPPFTDINLPDSIRKLGNGVFEECTKLQSINLPSKLTYLPTNLFSQCESLKGISVPPNVRKIGSGCFYKCKSLSEFFLPKSVVEFETDKLFGKTSCFSGDDILFSKDGNITIGDGSSFSILFLTKLFNEAI